MASKNLLDLPRPVARIIQELATLEALGFEGATYDYLAAKCGAARVWVKQSTAVGKRMKLLTTESEAVGRGAKATVKLTEEGRAYVVPPARVARS